MASFIPALSLFILILFNSYFTLPIVDEQLSSSTFPLLNDHLTTEHGVNLRLVPDDETTTLPYVDKKGLIDEHLGFEVSTSYFNEPEEKVGQAIRTFDELSTTESMTFTTESSLPDKRGHYDFSFTTVEPTTYTTESSVDYEQSHHDFLSTTIEPTIYTTESSVDYEQGHHNFLFTTIEPTTYTTESSVDYEQGHHDFLSTTIEPTTYTTESSVDYEQVHHDVSFTTIEPTTPLSHLEIRSFTSESETESESESETDKREIEVEFTTSDTLSFTSTEKYTGLLKSNNEIEEEQEPEESTKLMKTFKKLLTTKPSKIQPEDLSAEDPAAPTAVFDQEALKKISYFPNDFMVLDENNTIVVTDLPEKYPVTTMKYKNEQQPLTQGKESLQSEEKESDH